MGTRAAAQAGEEGRCLGGELDKARDCLDVGERGQPGGSRAGPGARVDLPALFRAGPPGSWRRLSLTLCSAL